MKDNSRITFTSNREFKQVRDLYEMQNVTKEETKPLIVLVQNTGVVVEFAMKNTY